MPNLGILKTLSICYYRIATEEEKDRKEENGMFYTKGTESLHFYLSSLSLAYCTLCFLGDLKEVRGGTFKVFFYRLHIYGALLDGFRAECENVERVYVEHVWIQKFILCQSFPLLLLKRQLFLLTSLLSVLSANKSKKNFL